MSAIGVWLQGRAGFLLSQLCLSPPQESPQAKRCHCAGACCKPAVLALAPLLWGFGVPPPSANPGGSQGSSGFTEGSRSSDFRGFLSHWDFALVQLRDSAQLLGLSVSDGDQQDLLLPVKTAPFLCKPVCPRPSCPSLQGPACGDTVGTPRAGNPSLGTG